MDGPPAFAYVVCIAFILFGVLDWLFPGDGSKNKKDKDKK